MMLNRRARPCYDGPVVGRTHPTPFVGRAALRVRLQSALERHARVTVVGAPGIGKSRLAREALPPAVRTFDLDGVRSEAALRVIVGSTLGAHAPASLDPPALAGLLGPELLFFDDAEGVVEPLADLVEQLTRERPELRVLVTSRERLDLRDEHLLEVPPLALCEAEALFHARRPSLSGPTDDTRLGALLAELDGLPLAIELAAARAHLLSVAEMGARLDSRLDWLARRGTHKARGDSLRAAIGWSVALLEPAAQEALATLALFEAPAPLARVLAALPWPAAQAIDALEELRDKSLLVVDTRGHGLLRSVRAVARSGPASEARERRFVDAWRAEAVEVLAAFDARGPRALGPLLGDGSRNLGRAVDLALELDDRAAAVPLLLAEARVHEAQGRGPQLLARLEPLARGTTLPPGSRARLLALLAHARGAQGQLDEAVHDLEAAVRVLGAETPLDVPMLSEARVLLSVRYRQRGELERAIAEGESALTPVAGTRSRVEALAAANLGLTLAHAGRDAEARRCNERALACFFDLGDRWGEALACANLGELAQRDGALTLAAEHLGRAVQLLRDLADPRYAGVYTFVLGTVQHERGLLDEAGALYAAAIEDLRDTHVPHVEGLARGARAALFARLGRASEAEAELALADGLLARAPVPDLREALALHRGWSLPVEARRALLEAHGAATTPGAGLARRLLRASLELSSPRLKVAPDGRGFNLDGRVVDLSRRGPLARVLAALVAAWPDPAARDALVASGWPGEQIHPEAASKRLRVAITTLRKLGLAPVLRTRDDGYVLTARVEPAPQPEP